MGKQTISGEMIITEDLDCVELVEEGCLIISEELTELTIRKLINHKTNPCVNEFDILVTGEDGKDAAYDSGERGGDGHSGGRIKITVKDLEGDVHIKAAGGNGGNGGTGKSGEDGLDGGDGGDGGDGAEIDFYYDRKNKKSTSYAYAYSARGGRGGSGGEGGACAAGKGGGSGQKGTKGGRCGDGGNGGRQGRDGKITIHHPDGGVSVNGTESDLMNTLLPTTEPRILDLRDDGDLRRFIQAYGGEMCLQKYPRIWSTVCRMRETEGMLCGRSAVDDAPAYQFETQITAASQIGVAVKGEACRKAAVSDNAEEEYDFYKFSVALQSNYYNSLPVVSEKAADDANPRLVESVVRLNFRDAGSGQTYQQMTLLYEDHVEHIVDEVETEEIPWEEIEGRNLVMEMNIFYYDENQKLISLEPLSQSFYFSRKKATSYVKKITVTNPHWHQGKTDGTIKFLYGRTPGNNPQLLSDADYWDENGPYHHNNNIKNLRTIIPISGDIVLRDVSKGKVTGAKIDSYILEDGKQVPVSTMHYFLKEERYTLARHREDISPDKLGEALQKNGALTYDSKTKTAHFDLKLPVDAGLSPYDWYSGISGDFLNNSLHKCFLAGRFVLRVEHEKLAGCDYDTYEITIYGSDHLPDMVTSYYVRKNATTVYIPPIEIYWGCFAKDTLITTADGRTRRADQIEAGDQICARDGNMLTVSGILTGEDEEIIRIVTRDGKQTRVSGGHAMLVSDGTAPEGRRMAAGELQAGDWLMTPDGVSEISEMITEPYHDIVYHFVFEGEEKPNYIEADGFWSGDFHAQNEKEEEKPVQLTEKGIALRDELRKFAGQ